MSASASFLLGALLGVANAAAALVMARRAAAAEPRAGIRIVMASLAARLAVMLAAVAGVLVAVPVARLWFVGGLGLLFAVGLVAEVLYVHGRALRASAPPTA